MVVVCLASLVVGCGDDGDTGAGSAGGGTSAAADARPDPIQDSSTSTARGGLRAQPDPAGVAPSDAAGGEGLGSAGPGVGSSARGATSAGGTSADNGTSGARGGEAAAAQLAEPAPGGPHFSDGTAAAGIAHVNLSGPPAPDKFYLRDTVGQGVAVLDANGDGRLDLYFVQGRDGTDDGGDSANRLYLNRGDREFIERGELFGVGHRGYGYGALAFDADSDGDDDLFVTNLGPDVLLRNDFDPTKCNGIELEPSLDADDLHGTLAPMFVDDTARHVDLAGDDTSWSVGAAAGDVDGDGALDLYVARYCAQEYDVLDKRGLCRLIGCEVPCGPRTLPAQPDAFFRNSGAPDYTLAPVSDSGLGVVDPSYGFQPTFLDVDDDGDLDLYVTNDSEFNFLFVNDGAGHFEETGLLAGAACGRTGTMEAGMGLAVGHLDDDAYPELFVTNFSTQHHSLYHNATEPGGAPWFEEISNRSGTGRPTWFPLGWGANIGDLDNDGHADILAANGHIYPQVDGCQPDLVVYDQRCNVFTGTDEAMRFIDRTGRVGPGLSDASSHRGSVLADLDDDGRLDAVLTRIDRTPRLAWNDTDDAGHWLGVDVRHELADGTSVRSVGARVTVMAGDRRWVRDVQAGGSFVSTDDPRVHVGLGAVIDVDALQVRWPGGETVEVATDLAAGRRYVVTARADGGVELHEAD